MIRHLSLAIAMAVALVGCASSELDDARTVSQLAPPSAGPVDTILPDYRIGPLDKLSVAVFQNQDLSQPNVQVDASGQVLLPLIGVVTAAGKTTTELSSEIAAKLGECCLQHPKVAVLVTEALSQQITVTGAVKNSGVYVLRGPTTLLKAVTMAGGPDSATANTKKVAIYRTVKGERVGALFDLTAIRSGRADDPEIYGGDTVIVDSSDVKSTWHTVVSAIPLFTIFSAF